MRNWWVQWMRLAGAIRAIFLGLGLCSVLVGPVLAHKSSDSYLTLKVSGDTVAAQWDIFLPDIQFAIGLDENSDDQISWGELQKKTTGVTSLGEQSAQREPRWRLHFATHGPTS